MATIKFDEIDLQILAYLQTNPSMSHSKIAKALGRSQPAISSRVKNLQDHSQYAQAFGLDMKTQTSKTFLRLDVKTTNAKKFMYHITSCPLVVNAFKISGNFDVMVFLATSDIKHIDRVIDHLVLRFDGVQRMQLERITEVMNPLVIPINHIASDSKNVKKFCRDCGKCGCVIADQLSATKLVDAAQVTTGPSFDIVVDHI